MSEETKQVVIPNTEPVKVKKIKQKKKKDPNAPKRGLSAYMIFANENRDRVRAENEGITFGQVGKKLGEEWKALTEEQKQKFKDLAEVEKKRYESEKALYLATK